MTWIIDGSDPRLPALWPAAAEDYEPDDPGLVAAFDVARIQCEAFAPRLGNPNNPPANYVWAQAQQARALTRAGVVGSGDQAGNYGDTVTVFPMDWSVKNALRPKRGRKVVR